MRPALLIALLGLACTSDTKGDGGAAADGSDGVDGADGADGTTEGPSLEGVIACDVCTGTIVVALFADSDIDPDTLYGTPSADLHLDAPGAYRFDVPEAGDWRVLAWSDEEPNGGPDPAEPRALSDAVEVADAPVTGVDLTLSRPIVYSNAPDCDAHALDTVTGAAQVSLPPEDLDIDGDLDEWGEIAPVVTDPAQPDDDCGTGGGPGADLRALYVTQDTVDSVFGLQLDGAPDPSQTYSVFLRQLDPAGDGPWGAGELEIVVENVGGDWQLVVVRDPAGHPEPVPVGPIPAGADGFEWILDRGFTGDLRGYRARAVSGFDDSGDETAFVELGRVGLADADGGPVPLSGGALVLVEGATEADLMDAISAAPEVALSGFDAALGLAEVEFDLTRDGTWAGDVEVTERIGVIVAALEASSAVEAFLPHAGAQTHDSLVSNADLDAWTGHDSDVIAWATNTIQAVEAQELFADCYPRFSAGLQDVGVLVVDASINDAEDVGRTGFDTDEFFFGDVTMGTSVRAALWESGQFAGTSWPHGLATSAVIAKRSTAAREGKGAATAIIPASGDALIGDRMSGILAFGGLDGSPAPGNQEWEFPLELGLWTSDWGGVAGKGWIPTMREGLASGDWQIMNGSWGELAAGRYCVRDNCEWNFGPDGGCVCDELPAADNACGGWQRHNVTAARVRAFGQSAKRIWAANEDTLFVMSSGNDCLDLDDAGGVSAWAEVDGTEANAMLVAGVTPGVSPDTVGRSRGSNYGDHAEIAAPYLTLTWKPGIYYYKEPGDDTYLTRIVWGYERGIDNTYRWAAGTSYSAPMTTAVAAMAKAIRPDATPAWLKQTLLDAAEPTVVTEAPRLLNAPRAVARAVDDALPAERATHIVTLRSTSFSSSCTELTGGETMGDRMAVECALIEVDGSTGAVSGGGQLTAGDPESEHEITGDFDLSALGGGASTFTLRGTDWMPGPGALPDDSQDHSWTRFTNVRVVQDSDSSVATAVWHIAGDFNGEAQLFEDTSGEPQARCTWTGTFEGALVETAHTGW